MNVVYQELFIQKRILRIKKLISEIPPRNGKLDTPIINFSFSHEHLKHQTALSKHMWILKKKSLTPKIQWSILKKSNTQKCFNCRCNLCLEEKIQIMIYPEPEKLLNQRCELIARCRHRNKFKLSTNYHR